MGEGRFPITRVLALRLVPLFVRWRISANVVSLLSLLAGVVGGTLLVEGTPAMMVCGVVGFMVANLLDECDGSVARALGTSSGLGSWLDTVVGCLVHMIFFISVGVGLTRQTAQPLWAVLGSLTGAGVFLATAAYIVSQSLARGRQGWEHPDPPAEEKSDRFEVLRAGLRTDFWVIALAAALLGWLPWLLWGAAVGPFLFWIPSDLWMAARIRQRVSGEG